jgi:hypothetical protein
MANDSIAEKLFSADSSGMVHVMVPLVIAKQWKATFARDLSEGKSCRALAFVRHVYSELPGTKRALTSAVFVPPGLIWSIAPFLPMLPRARECRAWKMKWNRNLLNMRCLLSPECHDQKWQQAPTDSGVDVLGAAWGTLSRGSWARTVTFSKQQTFL